MGVGLVVGVGVGVVVSLIIHIAAIAKNTIMIKTPYVRSLLPSFCKGSAGIAGSADVLSSVSLNNYISNENLETTDFNILKPGKGQHCSSYLRGDGV